MREEKKRYCQQRKLGLSEIYGHYFNSHARRSFSVVCQAATDFDTFAIAVSHGIFTL